MPASNTEQGNVPNNKETAPNDAIGAYTYEELSEMPANELLDLFIQNGLVVNDDLKASYTEEELSTLFKENFHLWHTGVSAHSYTAYIDLAEQTKAIYDKIAEPSPLQNELSEIPGGTTHVIDIWDQTTREQITCASALEKFWEDETNEYYFACIKSDYVMVMDSTGRIIDVVTALEEGLITVEDLDTYCIGYAAKPKSSDTTTEEVTNNQELPLTIVSNEKTIIPYFHLVNSKTWDGEYFVIGDGVDLSAVLDELEADERIPRVEYSQDFDVVLGDGVRITHILLFDETFNQLDMIWNLADLSQLGAGNYYIGIVIGQEGDYIAEVNEKESVGWACVVQLTIKFD